MQFIYILVFQSTQTRRRLVISDGTKTIASNQSQVKVPSTMVNRDQWTNLCVDINSFIKECFTRHAAPYGTPQVQGNQ